MANISFPRDSRSCVITLSVRRGTRSPAECSQSPDIHYLDYRSIVYIRLYILLQGHSPPTQLHTHIQCQTDQSTDTQPTTSRATLPSLPSGHTRRTGTLLLKMCMSPTPRSIDLPLTLSVPTVHLTEYPFLTHTKSRGLVLTDHSFYRIST